MAAGWLQLDANPSYIPVRSRLREGLFGKALSFPSGYIAVSIMFKIFLLTVNQVISKFRSR